MAPRFCARPPAARRRVGAPRRQWLQPTDPCLRTTGPALSRSGDHSGRSADPHPHTRPTVTLAAREDGGVCRRAPGTWLRGRGRDGVEATTAVMPAVKARAPSRCRGCSQRAGGRLCGRLCASLHAHARCGHARARKRAACLLSRHPSLPLRPLTFTLSPTPPPSQPPLPLPPLARRLSLHQCNTVHVHACQLSLTLSAQA